MYVSIHYRVCDCADNNQASADRRPVDPPPVVELRIYDVNGNGPDGKEDVTFSYEANFFLFATLEVARPVAPARNQPQPPSQQVPVLTGMPVSGMAYLDRPTEAGYFIFPDLSVRHEGKYRLSFNLYEETKKFDDTDKETSIDNQKAVGGGAPDASFDWRMEVKSEMFVVYSAKKFPGLAESTILSRTVAEQGCRVRIRRDVRMRRREGKATGDYDEVPEDDAYRGRAADQEAFRERSRSHSAASDEGRGQYPSHNNPQYQPQRSYTSSPAATDAVAPGQRLDWLAPASAPFAAPPPQPQQQFQPPPAPPSYPPNPQTGYYAQGPSGPPAPPSYRTEPSPSYHYQQERHYPQSANPAFPPREQREAFEPERRASYASYAPSASQQGPPYPAVDTSYSRPAYPHQYGPRRDSSTVPHLPPLKIDPKHEGISSPPGPLTSIKSIAPPLPSPVRERGEYPSYYNNFTTPQPIPQPMPEPVRNGGKRPFDNAFSSSSTIEPLHNRMRPSSSHGDDDDDLEKVLGKMEYRRADGTAIHRPLPHEE